MRNPNLGVKRAIYNALGDFITVGADIVPFYDRPQQSAPSEYVWGDVVDTQDNGSKSDFITAVDYEFTVVVRQDAGGASSLKLEQICDSVMAICERGAGLEDPDGIFNIFSMQMGGSLSATSSTGETLIGDKREIYRKIPFTFNCQEL